MPFSISTPLRNRTWLGCPCTPGAYSPVRSASFAVHLRYPGSRLAKALHLLWVRQCLTAALFCSSVYCPRLRSVSLPLFFLPLPVPARQLCAPGISKLPYGCRGLEPVLDVEIGRSFPLFKGIHAVLQTSSFGTDFQYHPNPQLRGYQTHLPRPREVTITEETESAATMAKEGLAARARAS